eukprot:gene19424-biopygen13022
MNNKAFPYRNGSGRGPDAGHTIGFEETDADRTRTGRERGRFSLGGWVAVPPVRTRGDVIFGRPVTAQAPGVLSEGGGGSAPYGGDKVFDAQGTTKNMLHREACLDVDSEPNCKKKAALASVATPAPDPGQGLTFLTPEA